jgi:ATP-dependent DNA ligase
MNFTYLYPEKPKLISINQPLFQKLSDDPRWVAEPKYNGNRLVLAVDGNDVEFWNRHGERFDYEPDENLRDALDEFAGHTKGLCVFDGELRHNKVPGIRHKIVLWDTLMWDGKLLTTAYRERREHFNQFPEPVRLLTRNGGALTAAYGVGRGFRPSFDFWTQDPEIEGLVIKNLNGKLNLSRTAGQDSNWMVKVRRPNNSYRF